MSVQSPFYPIGQFFSRLWRWPRINPNGYYQNTVFNSQTPRWINVDDLMTPYTDCPHLNVVINRKAELFSNGVWKVVDVNDEEQEFPNDPILTLLNNPNPLQKGNEFLKQYSIWCDIFSTELIYQLKSDRLSDPTALYILPSDFMQIIPTGKLYMQSQLKDIIKGYRLTVNGVITDFTIDEVIYNAQNIGANLIGRSKIPPLTKPISNIVGALQTRNILIHDKGVIGILANESKDASGGIPMGADERAAVEAQFRDDTDIYNGKTKVKITNASVKWLPMSYPVKDLMLLEGTEDDFATIIGAFNLDRDIFPSTKGATFENKEQGEKASYQNAIFPMANDLANVLTLNFPELQKRKRKLKLDYTHLPIMQSDIVEEARGLFFKTQAYQIMFQSGLISAEDFASGLGVDFSGTGVPIQPPQSKPAQSLQGENATP